MVTIRIQIEDIYREKSMVTIRIQIDDIYRKKKLLVSPSKVMILSRHICRLKVLRYILQLHAYVMFSGMFYLSKEHQSTMKCKAMLTNQITCMFGSPRVITGEH